MTDFNSISALGELTALPQTPLLDLGAASLQGGGWAGEEEKKEGGEGEGGKGSPQVTVEPETCYATDNTPLVFTKVTFSNLKKTNPKKPSLLTVTMSWFYAELPPRPMSCERWSRVIYPHVGTTEL